MAVLIQRMYQSQYETEEGSGDHWMTGIEGGIAFKITGRFLDGPNLIQQIVIM